MSHATYQASIDTAIEQITPLYDWLLVRRLHEEEHAGLVIPSDMILTPGGKWVRKSDSGPRRGEVVRSGRGDKVAGKVECYDGCEFCSSVATCGAGCCFDAVCAHPQAPENDTLTGDLPAWCPRLHERIPMSVQVGDVIIYPRFESTHVVVQGEQLTFVREGDVMAVLDAG